MQTIESGAGQKFLFIKLCSLESICEGRNKYLKVDAINASRCTSPDKSLYLKAAGVRQNVQFNNVQNPWKSKMYKFGDVEFVLMVILQYQNLSMAVAIWRKAPEIWYRIS